MERRLPKLRSPHEVLAENGYASWQDGGGWALALRWFICGIAVASIVWFACCVAFAATNKPGVPYNIKTPPEPQNRIVIYDHVGARHHASIPDSASEFEAILGRYRVRVEVLGEKP